MLIPVHLDLSTTHVSSPVSWPFCFWLLTQCLCLSGHRDGFLGVSFRSLPCLFPRDSLLFLGAAGVGAPRGNPGRLHVRSQEGGCLFLREGEALGLGGRSACRVCPASPWVAGDPALAWGGPQASLWAGESFLWPASGKGLGRCIWGADHTHLACYTSPHLTPP